MYAAMGRLPVGSVSVRLPIATMKKSAKAVKTTTRRKTSPIVATSDDAPSALETEAETAFDTGYPPDVPWKELSSRRYGHGSTRPGMLAAQRLEEKRVQNARSRAWAW